MNDDGKSRKRVEWLGIAKGITEKAIERRDWFRYVCPGRRPCAQETRDALKAIAVLTNEIAGLTGKIATLEKGGGLGVNVLLNHPTPGLRTLVAAMVIGRFNGDVGRDTRCIHDLVDIVAGRDPGDALAVRNMFRDDFPLRPHVNILYAATLDDSACRLKESSLNKLLGQPPDVSEQFTAAMVAAGRWDR